MKNLNLNNTLAHIILLTTAATTAYLIASFIPFANATIAALIAIISVKQTLHETLQETSYQIVGTVLGVGLSLAVSAYLGFQWWTIPIFITIAFTLATILKIGIRGGTVIALTIIFVTAPFIDESITSQQRLFGVALGVIIAALTAFIPVKKQPHIILKNKIEASKQATQNLLHAIGHQLAEGSITPQQTTQWVIEAETERNKIREHHITLKELVKTQKWSPTLTDEITAKLKTQLDKVTAQSLATKNITDMLKKIDNMETIPRTALIKIGKIIEQTHSPTTVTAEIPQINETLTKETIRELDDTQAILLTSSLYSEADKLNKLKKKNS